MRHLILLVLFLQVPILQAQVMLGNRFGWSLIKQYLDGSVEPPWGLTVPYVGIYEDMEFHSGGFAAAFTADLPIAGPLWLGAEVGYSERGFTIRHKNIAPNQVVERFKTGNISLSILPKVRIGSGKVRGEVFAGADVARWLNLHHQPHPYAVLIMPADNFNPYERRRAKLLADHAISLVGGAGLVVGSGPVLFHVNARYVHGITNIYEVPIMITDVHGYPFGGGRMFDRSILFSIGYSVSLSSASWRQQEQP